MKPQRYPYSGIKKRIRRPQTAYSIERDIKEIEEFLKKHPEKAQSSSYRLGLPALVPQWKQRHPL